MAREIPESDWKHLQRLKQSLLDRLCERYLEQIAKASTKPGVGAHQRYLDVYRLIQRRDKDLGMAFDDWRRSRAFERMAYICKEELFTDEEFSQFSEDTRAVIDMLLGGRA